MLYLSPPPIFNLNVTCKNKMSQEKSSLPFFLNKVFQRMFRFQAKGQKPIQAKLALKTPLLRKGVTGEMGLTKQILSVSTEYWRHLNSACKYLKLGQSLH